VAVGGKLRGKKTRGRGGNRVRVNGAPPEKIFKEKLVKESNIGVSGKKRAYQEKTTKTRDPRTGGRS